MTPAERAVIEAARSFRHNKGHIVVRQELMDALEALDAAEANGEPQETPISYGQVVAGDQLQNSQTKAWHEVLESNVRDGQAHIRIKGVAKVVTKPASAPVTVLRSAMGRAVDMFNIDWSGPNGARE